MAVRTPLKLDANNDLVEMSSTDIANIKDQIRHIYGSNPSVVLSHISSGGNLGTLYDTRLQAGASTTDVTNFDTAAETPDVQLATYSYSRLNQTTANTGATTDYTGTAFPVYQSGGDIYAMTSDDMHDTFIYPAIDTLTNGTDQPGVYRMHTSSSIGSLSGHSPASFTNIYADTRANVGAYTAAGIPETQNQSTTITNYYVWRGNAGAAISYTTPMYMTGSGNLYQWKTNYFDDLLENLIRHCASEVTGHTIRYNFNGSGNNRGTGMTDTRFNSSSYNQLFVNADDYRTQEFPSGSAVSIATNYLRIQKV